MGPEEVLTSLGSSVLGFIGGDTSQRRQQEATRENMMLQHALNKNEMNHSMQLQRAQQEWLMNTQYQKNVAGMKNAGLNPATANGVSPAVPSGGSPSTGSSGPSAGMADYNLQAGIDTLLRAQQVENETKVADSEVKVNESQADKNAADAGKSRAETEGQQKINKHIEDQMLASIEKDKSISAMNEEQRKNYIEERKNIIAQLDEIKSRVRLNHANEALAKEQKIQLKREVDAKVRLMFKQGNYYDTMAQVGISNAMTNYLSATSEVERNEAAAALDRSIAELNQKYGDAERIVGMIGDAIQGVATGVGFGFGLGKLFSLAKGIPKIVGFHQ